MGQSARGAPRYSLVWRNAGEADSDSMSLDGGSVSDRKPRGSRQQSECRCPTCGSAGERAAVWRAQTQVLKYAVRPFASISNHMPTPPPPLSEKRKTGRPGVLVSHKKPPADGGEALFFFLPLCGAKNNQESDSPVRKRPRCLPRGKTAQVAPGVGAFTHEKPPVPF
jgi:hypothetical protein